MYKKGLIGMYKTGEVHDERISVQVFQVNFDVIHFYQYNILKKLYQPSPIHCKSSVTTDHLQSAILLSFCTVAYLSADSHGLHAPTRAKFKKTQSFRDCERNGSSSSTHHQSGAPLSSFPTSAEHSHVRRTYK